MKKVLLIGDSINLHYSPYLNKFLKEDFEISSRPGREEALKNIDCAVGGNGGDSARVLAHIKERQSNNDLNFDVFVFNCGLHDIKRMVPEEKLQVSIEQYKTNLDEIYEIMIVNNIKCIFITSTPIFEAWHNQWVPGGIKRYNNDVCAYNDAATTIAAKHNADIIDLYKFTNLQIDWNNTDALDWPYRDYAHFNPTMRKLQAAFIAGGILSLL